MITRELELKQLLINENIDIIFLTETDTNSISNKMDYQIEDYVTILPKMKESNSHLRIICLVKNEVFSQINEVEMLMSPEFPSIWLEYRNQKGTKYLISGFYRGWSNDGVTNEAEQIKRLGIFNQQMELATEKCKRVIILGDANVCSIKWANPNKKTNKVAELLMNKVEECGMTNMELGVTFTSDIVQMNGNIAISAIDHIYMLSLRSLLF